MEMEMCSGASPAAPPERSDVWISGAQEGATPVTPTTEGIK